MFCHFSAISEQHYCTKHHPQDAIISLGGCDKTGHLGLLFKCILCRLPFSSHQFVCFSPLICVSFFLSPLHVWLICLPVPGVVMPIARLNAIGVSLYGGTILPGRCEGRSESLDAQSCMEVSKEHNVGASRCTNLLLCLCRLLEHMELA